MDHAGYKWWKHADPDMEQIQLEVVDIWHFGMSAMISSCENLDDLVDQISEDLADKPVESSLLEATEALAYWCISTSPLYQRVFGAHGGERPDLSGAIPYVCR